MKRHEDPFTKEIWYEEVLENGLHVQIIHKPLYVTSSCFYAVGYGSLDHIQTEDNGTIWKFPCGTAHYLEHKLFESDHGDVMADFSAMGVNVNAYTSYEETGYFFDTPGDIERPLNLLLDFAQDLHLSDESVEKEKGIILEERRMYQQDPDGRVLLETLKSLYKDYPMNEDIVGSEADIKGMRRCDLEQAYALNYHPSRAMLAIVTSCDPEEVMDMVRRNQSRKQFEIPHHLHRFDYQEPCEVCRVCYDLGMDVSLSRTMIGIKLHLPKADPLQRLQISWAMRIMLDFWFSSTNPLYQKWIDDKLITAQFSCEYNNTSDEAMLLFEDETDDPKHFHAFIMDQLERLKKTPVPDDQLERLRRRYLGSLVHLFNDPSSIADAWARNMLYGITLFDEMKIVQQLTSETCSRIFNSFDYSNTTCTYLHPMEQQ